MVDDPDARAPQKETVHEPHRDDAPPQRSAQPVVWSIVALVLIAVLVVALVIAAVRAA